MIVPQSDNPSQHRNNLMRPEIFPRIHESYLAIGDSYARFKPFREEMMVS